MNHSFIFHPTSNRQGREENVPDDGTTRNERAAKAHCVLQRQQKSLSVTAHVHAWVSVVRVCAATRARDAPLASLSLSLSLLLSLFLTHFLTLSLSLSYSLTLYTLYSLFLSPLSPLSLHFPCSTPPESRQPRPQCSMWCMCCRVCPFGVGATLWSVGSCIPNPIHQGDKTRLTQKNRDSCQTKRSVHDVFPGHRTPDPVPL